MKRRLTKDRKFSAAKACIYNVLHHLPTVDDVLCELYDGVTAPLYEETENGERKLINSSVFKCGCGLDTESSTIFRRQQLRSGESYDVVETCFCYAYQICIGHTILLLRRVSELNKVLKTIDEAVKRYREIEHNETATLYIWIANAAHEWSFLKYELTKQFTMQKCFAKTTRDLLYADFDTFQIRECLGLFGHSLAQIGSDWSYSKKLKGDLDYDLIRHSYTQLTRKERAYMYNDVCILAEMHRAVIRAYTSAEDGSIKLPYTTAGFCRMKLKKFIRDDAALTEEREAYNDRVHQKAQCKSNFEYLCRQNRKLFVSEFQWNICREFAFCGGLSGSLIIKCGKILRNYICNDRTSAYPAELLHKSYPCGALKETRDKRLMQKILSNSYRRAPHYFVMLQIGSIEAKTQQVALSEHKVINYKYYQEEYGRPHSDIIYNGKIRKAKNLLVVWSEVDIRAYKMLYELKDVKPVVVWYFSDSKPIPDFLKRAIIEDYRTKSVLKFQHKTDLIEYRDAKVRVNTYFGTLSTRSQDTLDVFKDGLFEAEKEKTYKDEIRSCWLNPYIAFYCTSYERECMISIISRFPDLVAQYDTDSLYTPENEELLQYVAEFNAAIEKKNRRIFRDEENIELFLTLGQWETEDKFKRLLCMGAKKYIKETYDGKLKTVIAGLPKGALNAKTNAENIKDPLRYFNVVRRFIEEGTADIIIDYMYAKKLSSDYDDTPYTHYRTITDYRGIEAQQLVGSYHALKPIDFTLKVKPEFLNYIARPIL